jgi:hypothetical protein
MIGRSGLQISRGNSGARSADLTRDQNLNTLRLR